MIDEVAGWMKPMDDGSGPSSQPMTTEGLIKYVEFIGGFVSFSYHETP